MRSGMKLLRRIQPVKLMGRVSSASFHRCRYALQTSLTNREGSPKIDMNALSRKKFDEIVEGCCNEDPDYRKLFVEINNKDRDNDVFRLLELIEVLHSGKTFEFTNLEKLFSDFELKLSSGKLCCCCF
jgi:hypothetical protein